MTEAAGLQPVPYCGSWPGSALTRESWSIILVPEKPTGGSQASRRSKGNRGLPS